VHAVEAHAEQMLDLLGVTPSVPAGRFVGAGDGRQARDGYDVATWIDGAGLSQPVDRSSASETASRLTKLGELSNQRYLATKRRDLAEVQRLGQQLAEAHRDYRELGGTA
jgi:hypothetical protein